MLGALREGTELNDRHRRLSMCYHLQNCLLTCLSFSYSAESINTDLTTDRPTWPLSSFGPAKNEPNLLDGLDVSPEELQLKFYEARQLNDPSKYVCLLLENETLL